MAEFLIRLRATSNGIVDLAGNEWTNNGVTISNTQLVTGGHAMVFDGKSYLKTMSNNLSIAQDEDFTLSVHYKVSSDKALPAIFSSQVVGTGNGGDYGQCLYGQFSSSKPAYNPHRYWSSAMTSTIDVNDNTPTHIAIVRKNNVITMYIDGISSVSATVGEEQIFGLRGCLIGYDGYQPQYTMFTGEIDDVCLIKGTALWDGNFTPPTDYLSYTGKKAFLSSNSLYTGASLTQLTNSWDTLTNTQKEELIPLFSDTIPSIANLSTISPFRILTDDISVNSVKVTGQPKPQTITPTSLINTGAVTSLQSITATNTITDTIVKFAITTDLSTYKVYDSTQSAWVTSTNIEEDGMSITQLNSLTPQILALLDVSNGIAFKQCFITTSSSASAELSDISAVVNITGSWSQSVHGTDYTVSYPNNTTMAVNLLTNGDYIINYPVTQ